MRGLRRASALRDRLYELAPPTRTALRIPPDRQPPPPAAFARFGRNSWLVPPIRVEGAASIEIGDDVSVLESSALLVSDGARLVLGDRARLAKGVDIVCSVGVSIGRAVSTSDYVVITDTWAPARDVGGPPPPGAAPVAIGDGAYLAWGAVVCPGVTIGAGAFVGEAAVVLDDVAPGAVVYGNPARPVNGYAAGGRR